MTQREWALGVIAPLIFARPCGTHPAVLKRLGIPREDWPAVWKQFPGGMETVRLRP